MHSPKRYFTSADIIDQLIGLEDSTTLYLESIQHRKLLVLIQSQEEKTNGTGCIIQRLAKLYFTSPEQASLYCISLLNKDKLTSMEHYLITNTDMPLGKIFLQENADIITKRQIAVIEETKTEITDMLNLEAGSLYKKTYDYWVGERKVGKIIEYFNEESIMRF